MTPAASLRIELARRWLLAAAVFGIIVFFFSPSWECFRLGLNIPEMHDIVAVRRGLAVVNQVAHPGAEVADPLHRAIQWRLLFPLIGRALNLPPVWLFALSDAGCLLLLSYLIHLLRRQNASWLNCAFATVTLASASWFFTSTGWLGYYDSWLALGLLLVAFAEKRWIVWLSCLLAPWIDERFVMAAPLAFLCRWLMAKQNAPTKDLLVWCRREMLVAGLLLAAFFGLRLGILPRFSSAEATLSGYMAKQNYLDAPLFGIILGVFEGLRFGWVFVFAAMYSLRRHAARGFALAGLVASLAFLGLYTAQDYSRVMTMLLPAAVLGLLFAVRENARWLSRLLPVSAGLAVVVPAYHVMNDGVQPIYGLQHELTLLNTPPPLGMSELYELRGMKEKERGELGQAEADLTLAVKLADFPSSALQTRGKLYADNGRWADAFKDFSTAVECDEKNPEPWFLRAQANLWLGCTEEARNDLTKALQLAPPSWRNRSDVTVFMVKLNQSGQAH